jgi:monofunctional biosynthetic peptidoglycan transglycosylase
MATRKKPIKKTSKSKSGFSIKKVFKIIAYILLILFVSSIVLTIAYRWINPPVTYLMVKRKVEKSYPIKKEWVSIRKLPPHTYNSAIASEDANFMKHNGFDFKAIEKAKIHNEKSKRKRGASTISQQVAKNVFLWPARSWFRKGLEVYFTALIEFFWSKERIMEVYLNVAEMGKGIYGIQAASRHYFKKDASKLTPQQSALIIASLPSPLKSNPAKPSGYMLKRQAFIMKNIKMIQKLKID